VRRRVLGVATLVVALGAGGAAAQGPESDWRVLESERFRIVYEAPAEAWTRSLAARLDAIRTAVEDEVGSATTERIDVLVADPLASANGSAWPLLARPRMVLWTTPPAASSPLAHSTAWSELVAVHETAHLAHLLRRSRHPVRRALEGRLLPVGVLSTRLPRWTIEGYATLLEGRLTGSGRPNSALRAAVLRARARAGRLPGYAALEGDDEAFLGRSMAYLAGSRFLEWQIGRSSVDEPLRALWAAATARADRGFAAAWERVFGESPRTSWARFVAESAAEALAEERRRAPELREGEVWLDLAGATTSPSVAPSGDRVAAIVRRPREPEALVEWSLDPPRPRPRTEKPADPLDPPAAPRPPRDRPEMARRVAPAGVSFLDLRFLPGGDSLLVSALFTGADGRRHADLAIWGGRRELDRRTRRADLRAADPAPDGRRAVAVRWRHGASQLVVVDLATGADRALGDATVDATHDAPRISPDGRRLAWLEHRAGRWRLRVASLDLDAARLGAPIEPALPFGGEPSHLAWRFDGSHVYVSSAGGDSIEIDAVAVTERARSHRVTRSLDAALAPAPSPDGRTLFYLGLDADGLDLRRLQLDAATAQDAASGASGDAETSVRRFAVDELGDSRPYGFGQTELTPIVAGQVGSIDGTLEAGLRAGDLVGRWEATLLAAARGRAGRGGVALAAAWRGERTRLGLHLAEIERAGERSSVGEVDFARRTTWTGGFLEVRAGAARVRPDVAGADSLTRLGLRAEIGQRIRVGELELVPGAAIERIDTRSEGPSDVDAIRLGLAMRHRRFALGLEAARVDGAEPGTVRLGGAPSSLAPWLLEPARIDQPALAPGTLAGRRVDSLALRLAPGSGPLAVIAERHRVTAAPPDTDDRLDLVGVELRLATPPRPLVALPALELHVGVANVVAGPSEGSTRWWLGLRLPLGPGEPLVAR